ncbi:MAG: alpha/beta fold hydrolase [Acidimicrobiales bacterium]
MNDRAAPAGPLRLAFDEHGPSAAAPVVVLHGFAGSAEAVTQLSAPLAATGFRVLVPDLVGHGRTPAPRDAAAYSMDACLDQLEALCRSLDLGTVAVVGYSMGGRVALQWAARYRDRVGRLLTIGATPGLAGAEEREDRRRADGELADRIEAEGLEWFDEYWASRPIFASQRGRVAPEEHSRMSAIRRGQRPWGLANSLRGMGTGTMPYLAADDLGAIRSPALVVAGADDQKFVAIGGDLADRLGRGRFVSVPDAGHAAHLESPHTVGALVSDFVAGR